MRVDTGGSYAGRHGPICCLVLAVLSLASPAAANGRVAIPDGARSIGPCATRAIRLRVCHRSHFRRTRLTHKQLVSRRQATAICGA